MTIRSCTLYMLVSLAGSACSEDSARPDWVDGDGPFGTDGGQLPGDVDAGTQVDDGPQDDGDGDLPDEPDAGQAHEPTPSMCPKSVTSQAELNALSDCEEASDLFIEGDDITSLGPLSKLRAVHGTLRISGTQLANLGGLSALEDVETLWLESMPSLVNLAGLRVPARVGELIVRDAAKLNNLDALTRVATDSVHLERCRALTSVAALSGAKLTHVVISENAGLTALSGLEGFVGGPSGRLLLSKNPGISKLPDLPELKELRELTIAGNALLQGLDNLGGPSGVTVREELTIQGNPALHALPRVNSAPGLGTVGLKVLIEDNDALASLDGLQGLKNLLQLSLVGNGALTDLSALQESSSALNATLEIRESPLLGSLTGLEHWRSAAAVKIEGNEALATLAGLGGAESPSIGTRTFMLSDNLSLTTMGGLHVLPSDDLPGQEKLTITNNPKLPQCEADQVKQRFAAIAAAAALDVSGNDASATCEE